MTALKSDVEIRQFVLEERAKAVSDREWQFRLRGYGFGITDSREGRFVTSLIKNQKICELPA